MCYKIHYFLPSPFPCSSATLQWCCVITATLYVYFVDQCRPYILLISMKSFYTCNLDNWTVVVSSIAVSSGVHEWSTANSYTSAVEEAIILSFGVREDYTVAICTTITHLLQHTCSWLVGPTRTHWVTVAFHIHLSLAGSSADPSVLFWSRCGCGTSQTEWGWQSIVQESNMWQAPLSAYAHIVETT